LNIPPRDIDSEPLRGYCAADARILAAYLFGSHAHGTARADSDVDIGLLLDRDLALAEELALRAAIAQWLKLDDVDLVLLRGASALLRYEAMVRGKRLYARDPVLVDELEARATMEYFDTAYFREVQQRLMRESLA